MLHSISLFFLVSLGGEGSFKRSGVDMFREKGRNFTLASRSRKTLLGVALLFIIYYR